MAGPAAASQDDPRLDSLFGELVTTDNEMSATIAQQAIWQIWLESGSDTVDLLIKRAMVAMNAEENAKALEILDAVVEIEPDFAEGWNKRATLHFMMGNYPASVMDIQRVLDLEPRHFGALSGLGMIMDRIGNKKGALDAWRRALAVNPYSSGAAEKVKELEPEVEGRGI